MGKDNSKMLKIFSKIYYVLAAICLFVLVILLIFSNSAKEAIDTALKDMSLNGMNPITFLSIALGLEVIFYALIGWLSSRVANHKSNGIALIVLLILNIVSSLVNLISNFNAIGNVFLVLDAFVLYYVFKMKKQETESK